MLQKKYLVLILTCLVLPVEAKKFEFENHTLFINAKSYLWYANTKNITGESNRALGDGGEESELEFKFNTQLDGHTNAFGEIEFASNIFNGAGDHIEVVVDDVVLGIKHKTLGQFSISKNNDDPVEKYITEGLEKLGEFIGVDEAKTTSSENLQIQYKSANIKDFNLLIGWAKDDNNQTDFSYALTYQNQHLGNPFNIALGLGQTGNNDTYGVNAEYQITNTKLSAIAIHEDSGNRDFIGLGIAHEFNSKHQLSVAYQTINANTTETSQFALSYQYQWFKQAKLYAEAVKLGQINNVGDTLGLGVKFSF